MYALAFDIITNPDSWLSLAEPNFVPSIAQEPREELNYDVHSVKLQ